MAGLRGVVITELPESRIAQTCLPIHQVLIADHIQLNAPVADEGGFESHRTGQFPLDTQRPLQAIRIRKIRVDRGAAPGCVGVFHILQCSGVGNGIFQSEPDDIIPAKDKPVRLVNRIPDQSRLDRQRGCED